MRRFLFIRIISLIPLWFGVSIIAFGLINLVPGDAAVIIAQRVSDVPPTEEQIAEIRREYGLDRPLPIRYGKWLWSALQGDFGVSYRTKKPVLDELVSRFPATLQIACLALLIALATALPLGILAAVYQGKLPDTAARITALLGVSIPNYWLGYLLILLFAITLGWFPVGGRDGFDSLVLPALTLGLGRAATLMRLTRSSLLEKLGEDFIRTAHAKGLSGWKVILKHALKGALIPVVTVLGISSGHLLGGAVIVERIFAYPGVGDLLVTSIYDRDYPVIQGFVLFMGTIFILLNLIADVLYTWIDPRIRLAK
jgi:peptide/nickel transport system permease protein